jgi:AraC family transcriptional regulator, regulatory protein of adaptative response / methylated-DNA-[protein]-cysteine methyltransferase
LNLALNYQMNSWENEQGVLWRAVLARDSRLDGQFVFAVRTTGIYCRPSCPSRRPRRDRVDFFRLPEAAEQAGFRPCRRCHPQKARIADPQLEMVQRACRLIEDGDAQAITLAVLGERIGVSSFHLQRTFKSVMGITPRQYAEACRVNRFKAGVRNGESITDAMYGAGFGSSSRLYESAASTLGMTPATYGKGGRGVVINYTTVECPLGHLLVGATRAGLCSVKLGDSAEALKANLLSEFPMAEVHRDDRALRQWVNQILDQLKGKRPHVNLPLDVQATAFQRRVWEQLRSIPYGKTRSYGEVAKAIGQEKAVRAVAHACATNPVAVVIPCHRVIREDKSLGGYRWGWERKKALLEKESAGRAKRLVT